MENTMVIMFLNVNEIIQGIPMKSAFVSLTAQSLVKNRWYKAHYCPPVIWEIERQPHKVQSGSLLQ